MPARKGKSYVGVGRKSSNNAKSIIKNAVNEANMRTMTPNWYTVLSCEVDQQKSRDAQCLGTCTPFGSHKSPQQRESGGESFAQSLEVVTESEPPIQLYPNVGTRKGGNRLPLL